RAQSDRPASRTGISRKSSSDANAHAVSSAVAKTASDRETYNAAADAASSGVTADSNAEEEMAANQTAETDAYAWPDHSLKLANCLLLGVNLLGSRNCDGRERAIKAASQFNVYY